METVSFAENPYIEEELELKYFGLFDKIINKKESVYLSNRTQSEEIEYSKINEYDLLTNKLEKVYNVCLNGFLYNKEYITLQKCDDIMQAYFPLTIRRYGKDHKESIFDIEYTKIKIYDKIDIDRSLEVFERRIINDYVINFIKNATKEQLDIDKEDICLVAINDHTYHVCYKKIEDNITYYYNMWPDKHGNIITNSAFFYKPTAVLVIAEIKV